MRGYFFKLFLEITYFTTYSNFLINSSPLKFLALTVSLEHLSEVNHNSKAKILADTLDAATEKFLENDKSPSRKVGELDNRGSHFYLAMYWAEALAKQTNDTDLQACFTKAANELKANENKIIEELTKAQGKPVDIGGYYFPTPEKAEKTMCPSETLNTILAGILKTQLV